MTPLDFLFDATLKVSAILAAGLAVTALLRSRSASLRHWVLSLAIAGALAAPLAAVALPSWAPGRAFLHGPVPAAAGATHAADASGAAAPSTSMRWRLADGALADAGLAAGTRLPAMLRAVMALWLAGVALFALRLGVGLWRVSRLAATARDVDDDRLRRLAAEAARSLGLRRAVRVRLVDRPAVLIAWGVRHPVVLLPRQAVGWSADRLRIVLTHELAHVASADGVVRLAAEILRVTWWFNPLVWFAGRALSRESELACDDAVLRSGVGGCEYAGHLLEVAEDFGRTSMAGWPAPAMARTSSLEHRVTAMIDARRDHHATSPRHRALVAVMAFALVAPIAAVQTTPLTLSGSVSDETGRLVPGVTVTLIGPTDATRHRTSTDAAGHYAFDRLSPGDYTIMADRPAFKRRMESFTLGGQSATTRDITLEIGSLSEELTVTTIPGVTPLGRSLADVPPPTPVAPPPCDAGATGGQVKEPRKIRDVKPIYPDHLRGDVGGTVILEGRIGADGLVSDVRVLRDPNADLSQAAADAVALWAFTPTLLNCEPVPVIMTVTVNFQPER
ncbi:MAG: M56 family metallopeptidase [Vicinamibacterales bacterium]